MIVEYGSCWHLLEDFPLSFSSKTSYHIFGSAWEIVVWYEKDTYDINATFWQILQVMIIDVIYDALYVGFHGPSTRSGKCENIRLNTNYSCSQQNNFV